MKKRLAWRYVLLAAVLVSGCADDESIDGQCEPCPEGFSCMPTPFGTSDCVPDNAGIQFDGGMAGQDMRLAASHDMAMLLADGLGSSAEDMASTAEDAFFGTMPDDSQDPNLSASSDMAMMSDAVTDGPLIDSPPTSAITGNKPSSRITRLDIPNSPVNARERGCEVVGQNAGSGLAGVFGILGTTLTEQLQPDVFDVIPLVLLSSFLDWPAGTTAGQYGNGALEFYMGQQLSNGEFVINENSFIESVSSPMSRIHFAVTFSGVQFSTNTNDFVLETSSFSLPFLVELQFAWLEGEVRVSEDGVGLQATTLNGYLTFESITRIVMAIQTFCNDAVNDEFCAAANQFLDGDPTTPELDGDVTQIARDIILPLMRNLDVRLESGIALECDPFCATEECVECNAVSVCAIVESEAVQIQ